jgi:hypothetical protein
LAPLGERDELPIGRERMARRVLSTLERHRLRLVQRPPVQPHDTTFACAVDEVAAVPRQRQRRQLADDDLVRDGNGHGHAHRSRRRGRRRPEQGRGQQRARCHAAQRQAPGAQPDLLSRSPDGHVGPRCGEGIVQIEQRVADVAEALLRILLEGAAQQSSQRFRAPGWQTIEVRIALEDAREHLGRGLSLERAPPREHLVEHARKRPHVGAMVHGLTAGLLGTHVRGGTQYPSGKGVGERRVHVSPPAVAADSLGDSEVQHLDHAGRRDLDVRGLQVAVDHACLVRGGDRPADLPGGDECIGERHRARLEPLCQCRALDQFQDQRQHLAVVHDVIDGADVRMVERGQQSCLAPEAGQAGRVVGHLRRQDLQRYLTAQARVLGTVDLAHASTPQPFDDAIAREAGPGGEPRVDVVAGIVAQLVRERTREGPGRGQEVVAGCIFGQHTSQYTRQFLVGRRLADELLPLGRREGEGFVEQGVGVRPTAEVEGHGGFGRRCRETRQGAECTSQQPRQQPSSRHDQAALRAVGLRRRPVGP